MHFKMSSAICFNLDWSQISSSGNGLSVPSSTVNPKMISNQELENAQPLTGLSSCTIAA